MRNLRRRMIKMQAKIEIKMDTMGQSGGMKSTAVKAKQTTGLRQYRDLNNINWYAQRVQMVTKRHMLENSPHIDEGVESHCSRYPAVQTYMDTWLEKSIGHNRYIHHLIFFLSNVREKGRRDQEKGITT